MKKKSIIIILTLVVFFLFSTTGFAKSVTKKINAVFGSYVIKLNGKTQKTETLANGSKVYIPIDNVTALTGASVKKSGITYAITPVKKEDGVSQKDVDEVKLLVRFMDLYKDLQDQYYPFLVLSGHLSNAYYAAEEDDLEPLNTAETVYKRNKADLENIGYDVKKLEQIAKEQKWDYTDASTDLNSILEDYRNCLTKFEKSLEIIKEYSTSKNADLEEENINTLTDAIDIATDAEGKAYDGYHYYLSEVRQR